MAIYVPSARRRRRLLLLAIAAFVLGGLLGGLAGRLTAPTPAEQVAAAQEQARQITAQLRVLSLHAEAGAASLGTDGDAGASFALRRAGADLDAAVRRAPWIPPAHGDKLRGRLRQLEGTRGAAAATRPFATEVERLADDIDAAFGLAGR